MDIFSLLNNDISGLSEEERRIAEKFNEDLRKKIIDDLAKCEINEIINELKSDEENFKAKLTVTQSLRCLCSCPQ